MRSPAVAEAMAGKAEWGIKRCFRWRARACRLKSAFLRINGLRRDFTIMSAFSDKMKIDYQIFRFSDYQIEKQGVTKGKGTRTLTADYADSADGWSSQ